MTRHAMACERVPLPISSGMCRPTSEFLFRNAGELGLYGRQVCGGIDGWRAAGVSESHCRLSDGINILDLTADQFGGAVPTVPLTGVGDPRYADRGPLRDPSDLSAEVRHRIGTTCRWDADWTNAKVRDRSTIFTQEYMERFLRSDSASFALMLAGNAGLRVFRIGTPESTTYAAGDPDTLFLWDAAELMDIQPATPVRMLPSDEVEALSRSVPSATLEEAAGFASMHPAPADFSRRAACSRIERDWTGGQDIGDDWQGQAMATLKP